MITQEKINKEFKRIDKREDVALQRYYLMDIIFFGGMSLATLLFSLIFNPSELIYKLFEFGATIVLK